MGRKEDLPVPEQTVEGYLKCRGPVGPDPSLIDHSRKQLL